MKYWRVEREEYVTQVVHVQAETKEEAIRLAEGKYVNYNSWFSSPWAEEMTESEWKEETEGDPPDPVQTGGRYGMMFL